MRAKPSSNTRASKANRTNGKSHGGNPRRIIKKNKGSEKNTSPDLSVLRQPVDTSIYGLKQAVKVFETGTPEVLHLLTYDCDVVYECKVCRNLFRSIANFISHKRVYCTVRYSRSQDLQRSSKEAEDYTMILGEQATERIPTRITARKDLTSIVESLGGQAPNSHGIGKELNTDKTPTTVHLEPMDNTSYGVFQTVLKPDSQDLMRSQVTELQNLLAQNEVILGPDGRILQNGSSDLRRKDTEEPPHNNENGLVCTECNCKFANRKTLTKHKRIAHESVRTCYSCPCCKNYFSNTWGVYRHLYKVHRKTNEQVRRLRSQIQKKDVKVEKPAINITSNKKVMSPNKKKAEMDHHLRIQQEWMDHFEDDWELQRCGGCGRKFERRAALISHSQICQKRIAAFNKIEQNHQVSTAATNVSPAALSPLTCSKKPMPKPSPEKKIGIQVRMNYCKSGSPYGGIMSQRQRSSSRSVLGDESDIEGISVEDKDFFQSGPLKNADLKESSVLEEFFKNANKCHMSEGVNKVNSYLNSAANSIDKLHTYEISTCKRSTFLRSNVGKNKSLEAKCLQLRSALESGLSDSFKNSAKDKDVIYFDSNIDNTSESNTSAISSLSSQLTPLVDKGFVCEVEQSIEIKNINISRTLDNPPSTEADSTSMSNNGGLHMTYNSHTFTGNIKFSPNKDATCEEVSTSVASTDLGQTDSNLLVDSSCLNDDEVSVDLKPIGSSQDESKSGIQGSELENTISILTRNQLKAICKNDLLPANNDEKKGSVSSRKKNTILDVKAKTIKDMAKKKFAKYIDVHKKICTICNNSFKNIRNLYSHMYTHTRLRRYECLYNGCTFQALVKMTCQRHVLIHAKENNSRLSTDSLVGLIDPSKWNLKIVGQSKNSPATNIASKVKKVLCKESKSQIRKSVSRLSKKVQSPGMSIKEKLKLKAKKENENKKLELTRMLNKAAKKQKLLTDFKSFSHISNGQAKKLNKKLLEPSNNKKPIKCCSPKQLNTVIEHVPAKDQAQSKSGKPAVKKHKKKLVANATNVEQLKENLAEIKKENREDEIIVNHITVDCSEPCLIKKRGSRSSSRKSSINSVDQQKGKHISATVKVEESNVLHCPPVNDIQNSIHIHSPEIVDSSSLEEEESQESDKAVDESHINIMEVIFGHSPKTIPGQSTGRPVRNKTRPKRDSDFILGSQKDNEEESGDVKKTSSRRLVRSSPDSKSSSEVSRRSK